MQNREPYLMHASGRKGERRRLPKWLSSAVALPAPLHFCRIEVTPADTSSLLPIFLPGAGFPDCVFPKIARHLVQGVRLPDGRRPKERSLKPSGRFPAAESPKVYGRFSAISREHPATGVPVRLRRRALPHRRTTWQRRYG